MSASEIIIIQTEVQPAAVIHLNIPRDEIQTMMGPAITEVIEAVTSQGIGPAGPVFAHHFGMEPGIFNFHVGVPVHGPVTPAGRVKAAELPDAKVARTIYTGPYEGLGEAWERFVDQLQAGGYQLGPSLWERYLTDPSQVPDASHYQTELNHIIL
ncbi:MAG: AraC family transcriptional regulator [Verrucomicrobiaceae bacterium]|nr:MAG: AraC family transcriptional regulator [Verrucomicrobiaceae bacterium]